MMAWHHLIELGVIPPDFPNNRSTCECPRAARPKACSLRSVAETKISPARCAELRDQMMAEYQDVFSDRLEGRALAGEPMHITLTDKERYRIIPLFGGPVPTI